MSTGSGRTRGDGTGEGQGKMQIGAAASYGVCGFPARGILGITAEKGGLGVRDRLWMGEDTESLKVHISTRSSHNSGI